MHSSLVVSESYWTLETIGPDFSILLYNIYSLFYISDLAVPSCRKMYLKTSINRTSVVLCLPEGLMGLFVSFLDQQYAFDPLLERLQMMPIKCQRRERLFDRDFVAEDLEAIKSL